MNLDEIATLLQVSGEKQPIALAGVSIDTRQLKPQELFVAIRGERFDGHDFIPEAARRGAAAILSARFCPEVQIPQLIVADPLQALTTIAAAYRRRFFCPAVALTGSNGKTTVKEMIAAILPPPSHATLGNLNNHIGVPLSILRLKPEHRYAVFELGANHPGEIASTVALVRPQVALINNIAPAHIAGFGSIEGVARAKGEIYQGLEPNGVGVVNADDAFANFWNPLLTQHSILRFSLNKPTDIYAKRITYNPQGCARFILCTPEGEEWIELQVPGGHNVSNALAAAACSHALGMDLAQVSKALTTFKGVKGRMTFLSGRNHSVVIDDTYNANLRSTLSALEVLAQRPGRRIFVFGDMGELGEWSQQHHEEIGDAAKKYGIELLMTCGQQSEFAAKTFGTVSQHFTCQEDLVEKLLPQLDEKTTVLVKGSRASAMEKIVNQLL